MDYNKLQYSCVNISSLLTLHWWIERCYLQKNGSKNCFAATLRYGRAAEVFLEHMQNEIHLTEKFRIDRSQDTDRQSKQPW
jgi:hypothetical protein